MFDAKKVLDALTAANQVPSSGGQGNIGDILSSVLGPMTAGQSAVAGGRVAAAPGGGQDGGGLGDILGGVLGQLQGGQGAGAAGGALGGLGGILGAVLGQATQGLQGAAQQTGATSALNDIIGQLTGGQTAGSLAQSAKDTIARNPGTSAAIAGTLGSLFLGTKAGRGFTLDAAKLGGLALIGGLAYQAWQNYQAGKPPVSLGNAPQVEPPPAESLFGSVGNDHEDNMTAQALLRAMVAAAMADGTLDAAERAAIVGNLQQIGMSQEAVDFLNSELAHPATPAKLAELATGPESATQIYTAARLTIDPDQPREKAFLSSLAKELGLDQGLIAQIDAAASASRASA
jgi:uncharacterized membrane protein YebE (DUF533 family)